MIVHIMSRKGGPVCYCGAMESDFNSNTVSNRINNKLHKESFTSLTDGQEAYAACGQVSSPTGMDTWNGGS